MSHLNRDRYRKKLQTLLARSDDEAFCQLVWAVDALQSGRPEVAAAFLNFPKEAATGEITSQYAIHDWELETLLTELLITPKAKIQAGRNRQTNCALFLVAGEAVNNLRKLEDAEASIYLKRFGIMSEMHRIGQRQFPWQRGYYNVVQLYRYSYLYGEGACAEYFKETHGLSTDQFALVGYALYAAFQLRPTLSHSLSFLGPLGITPAIAESALSLLTKPVGDARADAAKMIRDVNLNQATSLPVAYQPSLLRRYPVLAFGKQRERLRAPLLQLVMFRITAGLYYDLVSGGANLRNDASDRFENYCRDFVAAMLPGLKVARGHKYKLRGNNVDTPDILVSNANEVVIALECKATKLTFGAQFAEDPAAEAASAYDEIAKGIFQLWRYFSHARRGLVADRVSRTAKGIVVTLDTWLVMSRQLQGHVIAGANSMACKDPGITAEDRRAVVFCPISELESTLTRSTEESFLRLLDVAVEPQFLGWILPNVNREIGTRTEEPKSFPFELRDVLPWWEELDKLIPK